MSSPFPTLRRLIAGALAIAAVTAGIAIAPAGRSPAWAAGSVSVSNAAGTATADPDYATQVTVRGSGFQSIQGGFGGIYVVFGWVRDPSGGGWRPTNGGQTGADYRYVPDEESADNQGFQRFVAFPGSETEGAANAVMAGDGSWSVDMVVPGAEFESLDRQGEVSSVDCTEVTCGIITFGAHGVKNANNETFSPISFTGATAGAAAEPTAPVAAAPSGAARVGFAGGTVEAGNALTFTGQGFAPGEQVVATLDDGVAALGPLTAGRSGEVGGVLTLPVDLRAGTHLLTLTGAASGLMAQSEVAVTAGTFGDGSVATTTAEAAWPYLLLGLAIAVTLTLLVVSVTTSLVRARRRRKAAKAAAAVAAAADAAGVADTSDTEVLEEVRS